MQGSNSLIFPCYSLFRFWTKFLKVIELGGFLPNTEQILAANLKKFPVFSLLNREFGEKGSQETAHTTTQSHRNFSDPPNPSNFPANWGHFPARPNSIEMNFHGLSTRNSPYSPGDCWRATLRLDQVDCFSYTPNFRR